MIVSASRRTDLPALYPEWLAKRLAAGTAEVANPFRPAQVRTVDIGAYDTCTHGCLYCYATGSPERRAVHRPTQPRLT